MADEYEGRNSEPLPEFGNPTPENGLVRDGNEIKAADGTVLFTIDNNFNIMTAADNTYVGRFDNGPDIINPAGELIGRIEDGDVSPMADAYLVEKLQELGLPTEAPKDPGLGITRGNGPEGSDAILGPDGAVLFNIDGDYNITLNAPDSGADGAFVGRFSEEEGVIVDAQGNQVGTIVDGYVDPQMQDYLNNQLIGYEQPGVARSEAPASTEPDNSLKLEYDENENMRFLENSEGEQEFVIQEGQILIANPPEGMSAEDAVVGSLGSSDGLSNDVVLDNNGEEIGSINEDNMLSTDAVMALREQALGNEQPEATPQAPATPEAADAAPETPETEAPLPAEAPVEEPNISVSEFCTALEESAAAIGGDTNDNGLAELSEVASVIENKFGAEAAAPFKEALENGNPGVPVGELMDSLKASADADGQVTLSGMSEVVSQTYGVNLLTSEADAPQATTATVDEVLGYVIENGDGDGQFDVEEFAHVVGEVLHDDAGQAVMEWVESAPPPEEGMPSVDFGSFASTLQENTGPNGVVGLSEVFEAVRNVESVEQSAPAADQPAQPSTGASAALPVEPAEDATSGQTFQGMMTP